MDQRKARGIILLLVIIAGLLLLGFGNAFLGNYSVCYYNEWLGIPCPLCGLTRAVFEFMHFRFYSAWDFNPLVYPLYLWFGIETACYIWHTNKLIFTFLRVYRFFLAGLFVLMLVLRAFKYFPLP